jgi:hypothetical protein
MEKIEVAKRQLDGAIRAFLMRTDPIVVASLVAPASQILRDLNIANPRSISNAISEICAEQGVSVGKFWKGFNSSTAAHVLKHANNRDEMLNFQKVANDQQGSISFCVVEYWANTGGQASHYMAAFQEYIERVERYQNWPVPFRYCIDLIDRRCPVHSVDMRLFLLSQFLKIIHLAKSYLERHPIGTSR